MIVADASVIVPLVLDLHEHGPTSELLLNRFPHWISPPLWRSEVLNSLARYMRFRGLPLAAGEAAFDQAAEVVTESPFRPDGWMLRLVAETGCSAYDAEYAALAISTGAPLVTNDRRLIAAFRRFARTPEEMLTA